MKIEPKQGPSFVEGSLHKSPAAPQSARERAIAKLLGAAKPTPDASGSPIEANHPTPVPNPTQVSPEELGAIQTPDSKQKLSNVEASKAEVPTPEAPKPAEDQSTPPISSQFAQLARKEKAIRAQTLELKRQQDEFKAQQEAAKTKSPETPQGDYIPKDRLMKDTLAVLAEAGISYDQITELALKGPSPVENAQSVKITQPQAQIAELKGLTEGTRKSIEDGQKQQYQQAVNQIRNETKQLVSNDPNFEMIKEMNSVDDVVELITTTFEKDGILLTVEDAAKEIEEYLMEEAMKIANTKKVQSRFKPAEAAKPADPKPSEPAKTQQAQTLTNTMTQTRRLGPKERAILAFQGKLDKE